MRLGVPVAPCDTSACESSTLLKSFQPCIDKKGGTLTLFLCPPVAEVPALVDRLVLVNPATSFSSSLWPAIGPLLPQARIPANMTAFQRFTSQPCVSHLYAFYLLYCCCA